MRSSALPDFSARQLEAVLALVEYGSFVAAAARLRISQPALTRAVKRLERGLGVRLRAVPLEPRLVRGIGVIALREREPTPAAAGFLALLRREWPRPN